MVQTNCKGHFPTYFTNMMMPLTEDSNSNCNTKQPMEIPRVPPLPTQIINEDIVMAGFRDCTQEAIDFLVNVEKISEDDPLILGLKQHLDSRQQEMEISQAFEDVLQNDNDTSCNAYSVNSTCASPAETPEDSNQLVDFDITDEDSNEDFLDSLDFLLLAQNNPRIASLADEILDLINEGSEV